MNVKHHLKDERNEVIKACLNMGHIPVGLKMFNAATQLGASNCRRYHALALASAFGCS
jgi:hypothetical protein